MQPETLVGYTGRCQLGVVGGWGMEAAGHVGRTQRQVAPPTSPTFLPLRTHLCREVIPALQTALKQKALCSAERREERRREGKRGRAGRHWGGGGWRRLSRFIAGSREAGTEHSFNQTVTSPPGAAQRLENRSLLGSTPRLRFCSHTSPRQPASERAPAAP